MAIWQYPLRIVPKKANEGCITDSQITTDVFDKCLPRNKRYEDNDSLCWGDDQKTDAAIFYKNGLFVESSIRISLNDPEVEKYFNMALEFVAANDCVILDEKERLIESNLDALKKNLEESPQFRFVFDPKAYLENLQHNPIVDEELSQEESMNMKKIVILGVSCSGKSTLSERLAQKLGAENVDLDELYWKPGWIESSKEEFYERVHAKLQLDSWIVAGNYRSVQPLTVQKADTIIWIDYPRRVVYKRALQRSLLRIFTKTLCCNGNKESFARTFLSKNSILLWVFKDYPRKKIRYKEMIESGAFTDKRFIHLKSQRETDRFLNQLFRGI